MDTETVRLNITLPKDLAASLEHHAGPGRKSRFIAQAIRRQIESRERQVLEKALEEGYKAGTSEAVSLAGEFEAADLEGWDEY